MPFQNGRPPRTRAGGGMLGALGITGGLICTATMVLPALGAAGGMQGMTSGDEPPHDGLLGILTDAWPAILIVSTLLVTLGVGLRRPLATVPALAAGAVLYWGARVRERGSVSLKRLWGRRGSSGAARSRRRRP